VNTNLQHLIDIVAARLSPSTNATSAESQILPLLSPSGPLSLSLILLGNGHMVTFLEADLPNPPAVSFVSDILRLNSMWKNTSIYWCGESVLNICGQSTCTCTFLLEGCLFFKVKWFLEARAMEGNKRQVV